ncbi:MAG: hypothetical protein J0H49_29295 [Acidobacteria bacterium]|nr:hypothetical protein [Acidobacteriota bacterium]
MVRVTVQVAVAPTAMVEGLQERLLSTVNGVTVTGADIEDPFAVAVTVTEVLTVTAAAVAVKEAELAPAATVTDTGTVRAALLSEIATGRPPVGAAPERVTVHAEVPPELTEEGVHKRLLITASGVTVTDAVREDAFEVAVTVTVVLDVTEVAVAVKRTEVEPAATVTEEGTVRAALLSVTVTTWPPAGAALERVTVHEEVPPALIEEGEHSRVLMMGRGFTVTDAVLEDPFTVAVTVTAVLAVTEAAVAENEAEVEPAATVTDEGTVRAELLSEMATARPPVGAALERVTVHEDAPPEVTDVGVQVSRLGVGAITGEDTEIAPILTLRGIKLPDEDAARPVICSEGVDEAVEETENVAVATTESLSVFVFMPESRHVVEPVVLLQVKDLPEATVAELADTPTKVKSVVGYDSVHCNAAG